MMNLKKAGNIMITLLGGGAIVIAIIALALFVRSTKSPSALVSEKTNFSQKTTSSNLVTEEWKEYKNEQLGFSLKYPLSKQFEITIMQNQVAFMVPYTENGFRVEAFDNPGLLDAELWLENNFSQLYPNKIYKGDRMVYRDVRVFQGKFYVGDEPPFSLATDPREERIYRITTNNLEQSIAEAVSKSFSFLDISTPINTSRYTNEAYGISFLYPFTSMVEEKDNSIVVWRTKEKQIPTGTEAPPSVAYVSFSTFNTDEEWATSFAREEKLKDKAKELRFLGEEKIFLPNGVEASKYSFASDLGEWEALYIFRNNKIYRLNYISKMTGGQSFFEEILSSTKFF